MKKDFEELDQSINELRNASSTILLISKYEEQELKEKHLLRDLTETSISKRKRSIETMPYESKNVCLK